MLLLDTHIWIRWQNPQLSSMALSDRLIDLIETADTVAIRVKAALADIQVLPIDLKIYSSGFPLFKGDGRGIGKLP